MMTSTVKQATTERSDVSSSSIASKDAVSNSINQWIIPVSTTLGLMTAIVLIAIWFRKPLLGIFRKEQNMNDYHEFENKVYESAL